MKSVRTAFLVPDVYISLSMYSRRYREIQKGFRKTEQASSFEFNYVWRKTMKKIYVILGLALHLFFTNYEKIVSQENIQDTQFKGTEISNTIANEENSYFFNDDHVYLKAKAKYDDVTGSKFAEETACAEMRFIKQYEQGSVYKFVIEPLGALTDERLNIYFYVTNNKIYRLWSYVYQDDKVITFYNDDELLVKVLDTDEKLINNGQIVCQEEEVQDELRGEDSEFHFAIKKCGKQQIEYSSCSITSNGEIYYYENFKWEKGKGLIEFCSGYRAEREPLYLTEITQINARRYRRLLNRGEDKEEVQPGEKDYCNISDFGDFHYFLFCNTNIGTTATSVNPTVNAFIGDGAETAEAGVELYQKFMEPLWKNDHEGYMELSKLSPDAQLVITGEDVEGNASLKRWRFFDKGTEKEQQEIDINDNCPFRIIKNGDAYTVIDEETFGKKVDRLYDQTGYDCVEFNEQGNLAAGDKILYNKWNRTDAYEMAICDLENAKVLCTFYRGDKYGYVWQVLGDRESGKVVYVLDNRSFYEYSYPSGEIRYLGKDMYYPCYSPDGKYIAYSSPDGEAYYDLDAEEAEEVSRILPGIYILEVETGKTAYIKQDIHDIEWAEMLNTRTFQWVEKDCFEKVMGEREAMNYTIAGNYCNMDGLEGFNYYLFCSTQLHEGAGEFTFKPSIISSETRTNIKR